MNKCLTIIDIKSISGDVEQVKALLKNGANANAKDQFYGWSPLDYAAQLGEADYF